MIDLQWAFLIFFAGIQACIFGGLIYHKLKHGDKEVDWL